MIDQLFKSIVLVLAAALPFWIAARLIMGYRTKELGRRVSWRRELFLTLFFVYVIIVAAMTIAPTAGSINGEAGYNLVPVVNLINGVASVVTGPPETLKFQLENLLGNLFLLFPMGIFLPLIAYRLREIKILFLAALAIATFIEIVQYISQFFGSYRVADIDDVILNTLGACLGFYVFVQSSRFSVPGRGRNKLKLEL